LPKRIKNKKKDKADKMVVIDYKNNTYLAELCKDCFNCSEEINRRVLRKFIRKQVTQFWFRR